MSLVLKDAGAVTLTTIDSYVNVDSTVGKFEAVYNISNSNSGVYFTNIALAFDFTSTSYANDAAALADGISVKAVAGDEPMTVEDWALVRPYVGFSFGTDLGTSLLADTSTLLYFRILVECAANKDAGHLNLSNFITINSIKRNLGA